jgi:hypothetical protein
VTSPFACETEIYFSCTNTEPVPVRQDINLVSYVHSDRTCTAAYTERLHRHASSSSDNIISNRSPPFPFVRSLRMDQTPIPSPCKCQPVIIETFLRLSSAL